ncbi:MAG: hypothetical protein ACYS6W_13575 [Planctomycetota bacterium]
MRYLRYCLWMLVAAAVAIAVVACKQKIREEPQLLLEEPPLLLENGDSAEELPTPTGPVADNSRCHVCHINYEDEKLAIVHAQGNIGCERCHGASDAHCSDEDNITPPDIMFPLAKINSFCMGCHARDKISSLHESFLAGTTKEKYCTDCHGDHRLIYRTRKWDKTTGKLIQDDKVRMLTDETPE